MAWTDYSTAPAPGTPICTTEQVGRVLSVGVNTANGCFPLLVVRVGEAFRAYVNACPHQYLPLDYRGTQLLSADGTMLLCTAHGARFNLATGAAVDGVDCGLDPVPVAVTDQMLIIGAPS